MVIGRELKEFQPAEALALRQGLILAKSCFVEEILFESDNSVLIEACRGGQAKWEIAAIIDDIVRVKIEFHSYDFLWIANG